MAMSVKHFLANHARIILVSKRDFRSQAIKFVKRSEKTFDKAENLEDKDEQTRDKILKAALNHVPSQGWSREAVKCGAMDMKFPQVTAGIIENPEIDLVHFHMQSCNDQLEIQMKNEVKMLAERNQRLRIRPFIRDNVQTRLSMNIPFVDRWTEAMALMTLPQNFPSSLDLELRMFDTIWHYAGDKATDHNWYTKRLSLAAIYKATELTMIQDKSQDFSDTWKFLDRRFEDELNFATSIQDSSNIIQGVVNTVQNILGVSRK